MTEKEQCLKLIENVIKHHQDSPKVVSILKGLRKRVQLIGKNGGPLNELPAMHLNNSTNGNQNQQAA